VPVEMIGIDHVFIAVRDLHVSEEFYDRVMGVLGFHKGEASIGGEPHIIYFNRRFVYSLRSAREGSPAGQFPRRLVLSAAFFFPGPVGVERTGCEP
jgi:catechol 2,3-dioxygenase-like lactoylglutathione lyase family enzyme